MLLRKRYKKDILNGNIFEQMMLLFFPVFLGYILQQIYGFADAMVLGRFVGKEALASVGGSATAIINVILNVIAGMTAAMTVAVAQNYGRGDSARVNSVIRTGFYIATVFGGIISIVVILASPALLTLMKEPAESIGTSLIYIRLYAAAFVPYFIYQSGICIFRALGDNKRPNYFIIITAVVKIALDFLLAGVFRLGVLGTSTATFLSYVVSAATVLTVFQLTPDIYRYSLKDFGYDKDDLKTIMKMGAPFAIQNATYALPGIIIQSKINTFGTDAIAAFSAYNHVDNLFWCYSNAVGTVTVTMAGQNYGSRNMKRVRKIGWTAVLIEETGVILYGVAFTVFRRALLSMFVNDADVIAIGASMMAVTSTKYFLHSFVGTTGSVCKGCGLSRFTSTVAVFTVLITRIAFLTFYPHVLPSDPLYCLPLSWGLTSIVYLLFFLTSKKLKVTDPS
ncbi:MAG: MATE family efflux transporter [Erysipelotrichaceae bacterium]|nr:MATE family efflux transporter [Erysipelotrichaceae bacterium]